MRVLAVDPGYDRCGLAVIEGTGTNPVCLFSTCIETNKKDTFSKRLHTIGITVREYIEKYTPEEVALERLFFSANKKTALQVAETRGMLLFLAEEKKVPVFEYDPSAIKIAVTGYGRSTKKDIIHILPRLITITKDITHDDEYDAIAVGITHLASHSQ